MSDYIAMRMAQVFLLVALSLGIVGFVQDFVLWLLTAPTGWDQLIFTGMKSADYLKPMV